MKTNDHASKKVRSPLHFGLASLMLAVPFGGVMAETKISFAHHLPTESEQHLAAERFRDLASEYSDGNLKIELYGDLAGMFALANNSPASKNEGLQVTMVAGARNQPFRTPVSTFILTRGYLPCRAIS